MKKNKIILVASLVIAMVTISCESDEITKDNQELLTEENSYNGKLLSSYTLDELLSEGFELISSKGNKEQELTNDVSTAARGTELLKKTHTSSLGYTDFSLENTLRTANQIPKGVYFNGESTPGGRGDFYHLWTPARINVTDGSYNLVSSKTDPRSILTSKIIDNRGSSSPTTGTISYAEAIGHGTSWNVSSTVEVSTSVKANFAIGEVTGSIKVGVTAGGGGTSTTLRTITSSDSKTVPGRKRSQLIVYRTKHTRIYNYAIPFSFTGVISTNFEQKVNGHYYWAVPASKLLSGKNTTQRGTLTDIYYSYDVVARDL